MKFTCPECGFTKEISDAEVMRIASGMSTNEYAPVIHERIRCGQIDGAQPPITLTSERP